MDRPRSPHRFALFPSQDPVAAGDVVHDAPDFTFMMVKLDGGYGLAQVSKKSGEIEAVIDMKKEK